MSKHWRSHMAKACSPAPASSTDMENVLPANTLPTIFRTVAESVDDQRPCRHADALMNPKDAVDVLERKWFEQKFVDLEVTGELKAGIAADAGYQRDEGSIAAVAQSCDRLQPLISGIPTSMKATSMA